MNTIYPKDPLYTLAQNLHRAAVGVNGEAIPKLWHDAHYWEFMRGIVDVLDDWDLINYVDMRVYQSVNTILFLTDLSYDPRGISVAPIPHNWILA